MKTVSAAEGWKLKYPEQISMVVSQHEGRRSIIVLGWVMPTSFEPRMAAISIGHTRFSHELVDASSEFVLAFPTEDMVEQMLYCGTHSGRDRDKFEATGLTPMPADVVAPPLIGECLVNFECRVTGKLRTGDHTIFAGEIVATHVADERKRRLYNLGGEQFGGL